jgi:predicted nuclease of predicted toxin-antitoxin system
MKLLLDANISWRIVKNISPYVKECIHVDNCDLQVPAKDIEIWEYAKANQLIIITNDEDFINFSTIYGYPPKIVLIKTGNLRRNSIQELLLKYLDDIQLLVESPDAGILEIIGKY